MEEFLNKVVTPGWWGITLAGSLVFLASAATFFLLRRLSTRKNGRTISWQRIYTTFFSTMLLFVSGLWSGWAKYNDYVESDPFKAWSVAAGFVISGLVLSIILQSFAAMAKRENSLSRMVAVLAMPTLSCFWLCISPLQNARFLCAQETVRCEIEQQFARLDRYSEPIVDRYTFYRSKIIPRLFTIHRALISMAEEQKKPELGGCGPICQQFEHQADMLTPVVDRMDTTYQPDNPEKDLKAEVNSIRININGLLNGYSVTTAELRNGFYQYASRWESILDNADNLDSPELPLKVALGSLESLLDFLRNYRDRHADNEVKQRASAKALSTLEPLINDLKMYGRPEQTNTVIRPVLFRQDIAAKHAFNLASIASIRVNTILMRKHLRAIWPDAMLAFFIDFAGMSFIYVPMLVVLFRGRPVQRAMDLVSKRKLAVRRAEAGMENLKKSRVSLEKEQETIEADFQKRLSRLSARREKATSSLKAKFRDELAPVTASRQSLAKEMETALLQVRDEEKSALLKATSSADEALIRGKHKIFRENIREKYRDRQTMIANREKMLAADMKKQLAAIDADFDGRERQCRTEYERERNILDKRMARLDDRLAKFESAHTLAKQRLKEAEVHLSQLKGLGFSCC